MPEIAPLTPTITNDGVIIPPAPGLNLPEPKQETKVVEQPKTEVKTEEPTKDELIDFSAFADAKSLVPQEILKKQREDEAAKKELEATPQDKGTETTTKSTKKAERDYSDLEPEVVPLFKSMANDTFNKLKPLYLEHKKLKADITAKEAELTQSKTALEEARKGITKIPDNYYENENAFILTPDFQQGVRRLNVANSIYSHWMDQLQKVREGASDFDMIDFDSKQGQFVVTGKIKADDKSELKLMSYVNFAQNQLTQEQQNVQAIQNSHKTKYQQSVASLQQIDQQFFSGLNKEENKKIYDPLIADTISKLPTAVQNSPLAPVTAKALVLCTVLAGLLQQAANKINGAPQPSTNGDKSTNRQIQPSAAEIAGGGDGKSNKDTDSFTIDDFKRVKEGY